ncbi:hypothetical protein ACE38V_12780 [Cytobacillus sp. Hz8]|uniref:hypothetical protein n=1 Tax=Cytobacillus sp. Hz8 TaxID=3347168 RepID=UPI0035D5D4B3
MKKVDHNIIKHGSCDGCGKNSIYPLKKIEVLTRNGFREICFCESCFSFTKENGMISNAEIR